MTAEEQKIMAQLHQTYRKILGDLNRVCKKYGITYYAAYGTLLGAVRHQGFIPWDNDVDIWMTREEFQKLYEHRDEFGKDYEFVLPDAYGEDKYFTMVRYLLYKRVRCAETDDIRDWYNDKIGYLNIDIWFLEKTRNDLPGLMQRLESTFVLGLLYSYACPDRPKTQFFGRRAMEMALGLIGRRFPLRWLQQRHDRIACRYSHSDKADYYYVSTLLQKHIAIYPAKAFAGPQWMRFENGEIPCPSDTDLLLRKSYGDYWQLPPENERRPHCFTAKNFIEGGVYVFLDPEPDGQNP